MTHPNEETLLEAYYAGTPAEIQFHLQHCKRCAELCRDIADALAAAEHLSAPARSSDYGSEVWVRLQPQLPGRRRTSVLPLVAMAAMTVTGMVAWHYKPEISKAIAPSWTAIMPGFDTAAAVRPLPPVKLSKPLPVVVSDKAVRILLDMPSYHRNVDLRVTEPSQELTHIYGSTANDAVRKAVLDTLADQHDGGTLNALAQSEHDARMKSEILHRLKIINHHLTSK